MSEWSNLIALLRQQAELSPQHGALMRDAANTITSLESATEDTIVRLRAIEKAARVFVNSDEDGQERFTELSKVLGKCSVCNDSRGIVEYEGSEMKPYVADCPRCSDTGHSEITRLRAELAEERARLDWLEQWYRWRPGSRREIWTGAAGFQLVERSSNPIDKPARKLREAIDAARAKVGREDE